MSSKIGLAVVGLGRSGLNRLQGLREMGDKVNVRWILEKEPAVIKQIQRALGAQAAPKVINPNLIDQVYKDNSVDAVVVLTPCASVNTVRRSLKHAKAVLCEHPISLDSNAVVACYEEAQAARKPLMFTLGRRFDASVAAVYNRLQAGEVGRIHTIRALSRHKMDPSYETPSNLLNSHTVHDADTLCWLLKDLPNFVYSHHGDNCVGITFRFPDGALGTIDINILKEDSEQACGQKLEICGTQGVITLEQQTPLKTTIKSVGQEQSSTTVEHETESFLSSFRHFINVIDGTEKPQVTISDTLRACTIATACEESYKSNTAVQIHIHNDDLTPEDILDHTMWKERPDIC